jgi:threonine dehydratase
LTTGRIAVHRGESVVAILSGGNIDLNLAGRIVDRGLVGDGRLARLAVTVPDRPGSLAMLTRLVAEAGANVLEVVHGRAFADISVRDVEIVMLLETRGTEHTNAIMKVLDDHGVAVRQDVRGVE